MQGLLNHREKRSGQGPGGTEKFQGSDLDQERGKKMTKEKRRRLEKSPGEEVLGTSWN